MKFFIGYLKQNFRNFIAFILCSAAFITVFYLYHISVAAAAYPSMICLGILIIHFLISYIRAFIKHREINQFIKNGNIAAEQLKKYNTLPDKYYIKLIESFENKQRELQKSSKEQLFDMIDYYTTWAHQIKTPIASMRLTLEQDDTAVSYKLKEDLFRIEQYADMVLTYLRLDSESTDYVFKTYDIDILVQHSIKKFAASFISKGIKLNFTSTNLKELTDEKWFSFVLDQLISNSLKYTDKGSIGIFKSSEDTLCIKDTGIGIEPQDLPRIFEKGYTGYNGRKGRNSSGLGLYLCKRICDNLNCTLRFESESGSGTSVFIKFNCEDTVKE